LFTARDTRMAAGEGAKKAAKKSASKDPIVATVAGALAGMVETCVVWPMEFTKTAMQLRKEKVGMLQVVRETVRGPNGPAGLYRGMSPVLIGSIPKAGIRFGGFNYFQSLLRLEDGKSTPARNLAAGMAAGALEAVVAVAPLETIKTKLIDGNKSFMTGLREILRADGIRGIYKGVLATTGKQSSNQGLRFMFFGVYTTLLTSDERALSSIESLVGGMAAGCFSTILNNPLDVAKSRQQSLAAAHYGGLANCLKMIVQQEGVLALWKGTVPRMARVVPGQGVIFMSYNSISDSVAVALGKA
jgi:solute carrier family 25 citrate transporter 1